MQAILNIAIRAARKAGAHLIRERSRMDSIIDLKQLTTLQGQAETIITEVIQKAYPDHGVLAAHSGLEAASQQTVWHLDIVNGLENLVRNIPHYAITMLIEEANKPKYVLVYEPNTDEIFTAYVGGGVQCNEYRLRVNKVNELDKATVAVANAPVASLQTLAESQTKLYTAGSTLLSLAYVAAGRLDGFIGRGLTALEIKVGEFLLKEAGGLTGDLSGGHNSAANGELLGANTKFFKTLVCALN